LSSLRWNASPAYAYPLLIRGRRVDGASELRFGGTDAQAELAMPAVLGQQGADWRVWGWQRPILVSEPGCYAVQVDGADFSEVIVFEVALTPLPDANEIPQP